MLTAKTPDSRLSQHSVLSVNWQQKVAVRKKNSKANILSDRESSRRKDKESLKELKKLQETVDELVRRDTRAETVRMAD